jgi:hypothetical protein
MDWAPWPQVDNAVVDENEVELINNLADIAVANAVGNVLMQHPEQPQNSSSISSDTQAFFRAQGAPITLKLPLPESTSACRTVTVPGCNEVSMNDDYPIRRLAAKLGLHQCFGPSPSIEMIIQDLAQYVQSLQAFLPMKEPLPSNSWNFVPTSSAIDTWFLNVDNLNWGNNAEASSSTGVRKPRLEFTKDSELDNSDSSYIEFDSPFQKAGIWCFIIKILPENRSSSAYMAGSPPLKKVLGIWFRTLICDLNRLLTIALLLLLFLTLHHLHIPEEGVEDHRPPL